MKRICVVTLATLLLLSCHSPVEKRTVNVTVSASFSGAAGSRTVVPDFAAAVDEIDVALTSNDGYAAPSPIVDTTAPWEADFTGVTEGSWNIDVVARHAGTQIGSGSAQNCILAAGSALLVTVPVTFSSTGAAGSVQFAISLPSTIGIDYVNGTIEETGTAQAPTLQSSGGTSRATFAFSNLTTGSQTYSLVMAFKRGGASGTDAGTFREKLYVVGGFQSSAWVDSAGTLAAERAFVQTDFLDADASLSDLTVGSVLPGTSFASGTLSYGLGTLAGLPGSLTFTPTESISGQYLQYSWNRGAWTEIRSGDASGALALSEDNTLVVRVTAPDRQTTRDYTVTFSRGYTLTYNGNGNDGGSAPAAAVYKNGDSVTIAGQGTLSRTGRLFAGWNTAFDGSGTAYAAGTTFTVGTADVDLYAQWVAPGTVAVSFSLPSYQAVVFTYNATTVTTLAVVRSATPLSLSYNGASASVSGWEWYLDGVNTGATASSYSLPVSTDGRYVVSCSAMYGGVKYAGSLTVTVTDPLTVTYNGNGASSGTVPTDSNTYVGGQNATVLPNTNLIRTGYTFTGWNTAADGSGSPYAAGNALAIGTSSITLFAVWVRDTTPPSAVTGVTASTAAGSVTLHWTDPTDADLAGIRVEYYGDTSGSVVIAKGIQTAIIGGLDNLTGYTFSVFAYDLAGNFSASVDYWACPGGPVQSDFTYAGGQINGYTGSATSVVIPDGINGVAVTSIAASAFGNRASLTWVRIPASVSSIGDAAFLNCTALATIVVDASAPAPLGAGVFDNNAPGRTILVPRSAKQSVINAYKAAPTWASYVASIQEQP